MRVMVYWAMVGCDATLRGAQLIEGPDALREAAFLMKIKQNEGARFVGCAPEFADAESDASERPAGPKAGPL